MKSPEAQTEPEAQAKQTLSPELRDEISRHMAQKTLKDKGYTKVIKELRRGTVKSKYVSLTPRYVNTGPERYTQTDFSDSEDEDKAPVVSNTELLRPLKIAPNQQLRINQYISEVNDGHELTTDQYMQIMNRLLRLQSLGLIERSLNGIELIENEESKNE